MATQLLVATRNAHKTAEFAAMLGPEFVVQDLRSLPELPPVEETGTTFEENAVLKALTASAATSSLVVADDSGLEVAALGGAPGVYSARYAGPNATDAENIAKLLRELRGFTDPHERAARFRCALALAKDGKIVTTVDGGVEGAITVEPCGAEGFGYDPVFVPTGWEQTFAQAGAKAKNRISHRTRALAKLRAYLTHAPDGSQRRSD